VPRPALWQPVLAAATVLAATGYVAAVDPSEPGHFPACPFYAVSGYYCPGCGSLRAVHALTQGDPSAALHDNLLTVLAIPVAIGAWMVWFRRVRARRPGQFVLAPWLLWAGLGVMVVFTVVRNLPGFAWLAPQ
jgi:hypothetical protein